MSLILTPNGALPLKDARPAEAGKMWSMDGRRQVAIDSVPGAWELNLYCLRAYALSDVAAWYQAGSRLGAPDLGDLKDLAELDKLQALRTLVVLLPLMADVYDWQDLPTDSSSRQVGKLNFGAILSDDGRVLRRFETTDDWRDFAAELDRDYLIPAGIILLPPEGTKGLPVLPPLTWAAISLISSTLIVATAVVWALGRITSYAGRELDAIEGRLACFDRWAEEYAETGNPRAREAMEMCHRQTEELADRSGLGSLLWPIVALTGIVAYATLSD